MPPSVDDRLIDIRDSIIEIETTLAAMTRDDFLAQRPKRLITERLLNIICEATRRLPDDVKKNDTTIAWQQIIAFGNLLRHAYHSTKADLVWDIVQNDLSALKTFAARVRKACSIVRETFVVAVSDIKSPLPAF